MINKDEFENIGKEDITPHSFTRGKNQPNYTVLQQDSNKILLEY
jgi:hypothetical protein